MDGILFPTDGSDAAASVFEYVLDIASDRDVTVHVLNVADTTRTSHARTDEGVVDTLESEGERIVEAAAERATDRSVDVVTAVLQGEPYRTIVDYAAEQGVDLVAMPTHGRRGLERFLLGSVTERVIRICDTPVLTMRPDDQDLRYPPRNVLVPTDGSQPATEALETGIDTATATGSRLHVLSVIETTSLGMDVYSGVELDQLEDHAAEVVSEATSAANEASVDVVAETTYGSSIHREICTYVEQNDVDLVVVGTHGRTGFDRYLLGSVAEKLVRASPVPVLAVRGQAEE